MRNFECVLLGVPVPYTRTHQRGRPAGKQALRYLKWKKMAALDIATEASGDTMEMPVRIGVALYLTHFRGDWDNYYKAILDACQLARIIPNDNLVNVKQPLPCPAPQRDKENPRIVITIESVGER